MRPASLAQRLRPVAVCPCVVVSVDVRAMTAVVANPGGRCELPVATDAAMGALASFVGEWAEVGLQLVGEGSAARHAIVRAHQEPHQVGKHPSLSVT